MKSIRKNKQITLAVEINTVNVMINRLDELSYVFLIGDQYFS